MELVHKIWKEPIFLIEGGRQSKIFWKLKVLNTHTRLCYKESIERRKAQLGTLESDIRDKILKLVGDSTNLEVGKYLQQMELERNKTLLGFEEQ